jgi:peptidoglycan/LPS O-acetylase OafA/YrhL
LTNFNPILHGLRGLAAIGVFLFHWSSLFPEATAAISNVYIMGETYNFALWIGFGGLGVPLFFVLSGYLLASQLSQQKLSLSNVRRFYARRFLRIYPAVWVQFIILLFIASSSLSFFDVFLNLILWVNLPPWMTPPLNGVWWTLPTELCFYLLLPFVIEMQRKAGIIALLVFSLFITVGWRTAVIYFNQIEDYRKLIVVLDSIPGYLSTFIAGVSICFVKFKPTTNQRRLGFYIAGLIFIGLVYWLYNNIVGYWTGHWMLATWNSFIGITIACGVYFILNPMPESKIISNNILVWVGEISFGIYLWHLPIQLQLKHAWPDVWASVQMSLFSLFASAVITLIIASISYYFIEKPLMSWRRPIIPKVGVVTAP